MKKKILTIIMVVTMIFSLADCGVTVENANESNNSSMFVLVESTVLWEVVYHKETKVMYVVSRGVYNQGTFTIMVDSDGNPLIYEK